MNKKQKLWLLFGLLAIGIGVLTGIVLIFEIPIPLPAHPIQR